ncbi:MAG: leucine-rich repeat protein [Spirochaetes bacterium]|nr:leucine-rich repeat protein [Spirochaetota bacterium]MBN2770268.1 leucine-rich repeat protein [Spirochaetota bacterium]
MKMEKILLALLSVLLVSGMFALTACGGGGGGTDDKDPGTKDDPGITDDTDDKDDKDDVEEEIATFKVTFETNGGGSLDVLIVEEGSLLTLNNTIVPEPEEGKYFAGWYKDAECSDDQLWDFANDRFTADITLYAKWGDINGVTESKKSIYKISGSYLDEYNGSDNVIAIPKQVTIIYQFALKYVFYVKYIILPEGVTTIRSEAFYQCRDLVSIYIPDSVGDLGTDAFNGCKNLISVKLPKQLKMISGHAFDNCSSLTSVTMPDSEEFYKISASAFSSCISLTSIKIPDSVTQIGSNAFWGCSNLSEVYLPASPPDLINNSDQIDAANNAFYKNAEGRTFYVPAGSLADYQDSESWVNYIGSFVELSE